MTAISETPAWDQMLRIARNHTGQEPENEGTRALIPTRGRFQIRIWQSQARPEEASLQIMESGGTVATRYSGTSFTPGQTLNGYAACTLCAFASSSEFKDESEFEAFMANHVATFERTPDMPGGVLTRLEEDSRMHARARETRKRHLQHLLTTSTGMDQAPGHHRISPIAPEGQAELWVRETADPTALSVQAVHVKAEGKGTTYRKLLEKTRAMRPAQAMRALKDAQENFPQGADLAEATNWLESRMDRILAPRTAPIHGTPKGSRGAALHRPAPGHGHGL